MPVALNSHLRLFIAIGFSLAFNTPGRAQLDYRGGLLRQDFNSLPREADPNLSDLLQANAKGPVDLAASPPFEPGCSGWSIYARVGSPLSLKVGNGSLGTPAAYSFGQTSSMDRALGSLAGGAMAANFGLRLKNSTGRSISSFTLVYTQEQWRNGGTALPNGLTLEYRITATSEGIESGKAFANLDGTTATSNSSSAGPLDGEAPANRRQYQAKVTPASSWLPDQFLILRWRDLDETGADNALAIDDVLFHATGDGSPSAVIAASPQDGAIPVSPNALITLDFNQPLEISSSALHLRASLSGELAFSSQWFGGMRLILTPDQPLPAGEEITLSLAADQINAAPAMSADYQLRFTVLPPADQPIPIHSIQGRTGTSPLVGREVSVTGVVTASFQGGYPALGGYCLQAPLEDHDADPLTSEGLWIDDSNPAAGNPIYPAGTRLSVRGTIDEVNGTTTLTPTHPPQPEGEAIPPAPLPLHLPIAHPTALEAVESMLVEFPQTLFVTRNGEASYQTDNYALYGELLLCADGPQLNPTQWIDPNDSEPSGMSSSGTSERLRIQAAEDAHALNALLLDDASRAYRPTPTPYLNALGTRRIGDSVTGLRGIIVEGFGSHRLHPESPVTFADHNARPETAPQSTGRLRIVAQNLLNYFVTTGGADDRGASTEEERQRQRSKLASALAAMQPDLIGVMELQNHPLASPDFMAALRSKGLTHRSIVDPSGGYPTPDQGADVIRCQWFYRREILECVGEPTFDSDSIWAGHRPPLAQVFREIASGESFIACLCHFKSKSSSGASGLDMDQGDGQGAYNFTRVAQAARLHAWLAELTQNAGEQDCLIIGDFNSNAQEDPLDLLRFSGWQDCSDPSQVSSYSYQHRAQRGCLDHAFATPGLIPQITAATRWHINADEPLIMDYHHPVEGAMHPYRCSDHDPVILDLNLNDPNPSFKLWALAQEDPETRPPAADPDNDGLSNLAEFLLALDPKTPSPQPLQLKTDRLIGTQILWQQRRHFKAAELQLQMSVDLQNWSPLPSQNLPDHPSDAATLLKQATLPPPLPDPLFLRLMPVEESPMH